MTQKRGIKGKKIAFLTLGCKVNSYETEGMRALFLKAGAVEVSFEEEADVYIVNTCSVTNMADRKSRQMLHRAKKNGKDALIVAVGCYAQAAGESLGEKEGIDLVVGNNKKAEIVELTEAVLEQKERSSRFALADIGKETRFEEMPIETVTERTRAYIKIEDGCNQFCSYCIIPYVRGRVRSRKPSEVLAEIRRLAAEGYREVVLTGIHLSSYGLDWNGKDNKVSGFDETLKNAPLSANTVLPLLDLLKQVQEVPGIERIRLGSLEPRIMTEAFVKELAGLSKVCPHFHLSLQSGCDATLKRMNRKYTASEYREAVECLRRYFMNPAITTDIIVGFPGETEEEFAESLQFAKDIAFSQIHIFKYSRRGGTAADRMKEQVPEEIKTRRSELLSEAEKELEDSYRELFFGTEDEVLLEEEEMISGKRYLTGHTTRYIKVAVEDTEGILSPNEMIKVRLSKERKKDTIVGVRL